MKLMKYDKLLHFFVGFWITFIISIFLSNIIVILAVLFIATAKEIYDKRNNGSVELLDILFTCLPLSILLIVK